MTVISNIEELSALPGPVALAIGVFDGVHLGHREVIRGALDYSEKHGGTAAVLTFDPHPLQVLRPEVHGSHLGKKLGFPTANLAVENEELPPNGVYAVSAEVGGQKSEVRGVANLGLRPTVEPDATERTLEVHLFDSDRDLYGA